MQQGNEQKVREYIFKIDIEDLQACLWDGWKNV